MKKLFLIALFSGCFLCSFGQISTRPGTTKTDPKDTTKLNPVIVTTAVTTGSNMGVKENYGAPIKPDITTLVVPPNNIIPGMTNTTPPATGNTGKTNLSLEELNKKVADLETQLNYLSGKLPFHNMAVMTIESSEKNMQSETKDFTYYKQQIRIDNSLSNNNPKAIIFAMFHAESKDMQLVNTFYNSNDGFWYLSVPMFKSIGIDPYRFEDKINTYGEVFDVDVKPSRGERFDQWRGVAAIKPFWPQPGSKFSVLIFKELPNQAIIQAGSERVRQ